MPFLLRISLFSLMSVLPGIYCLLIEFFSVGCCADRDGSGACLEPEQCILWYRQLACEPATVSQAVLSAVREVSEELVEER